MAAQYSEFTKCHCVVHFEMVEMLWFPPQFKKEIGWRNNLSSEAGHFWEWKGSVSGKPDCVVTLTKTMQIWLSAQCFVISSAILIQVNKNMICRKLCLLDFSSRRPHITPRRVNEQAYSLWLCFSCTSGPLHILFLLLALTSSSTWLTSISLGWDVASSRKASLTTLPLVFYSPAFCPHQGTIPQFFGV